MENWGLITYRETALLYEEGVNPATSKQWVAVVIAHELAHQVSLFVTRVEPPLWGDLERVLIREVLVPDKES